MGTQKATVAACLAGAVLLGVLPLCAFHLANWAMWDGRLGDYQKTLWNTWYQFVMHMAPVDEFAIMNWGLGSPTNACAKDSPEKPQANLYLELANLAESKGRVLEVGSGRGGGAQIIAKCKCPSEYIGVDLSAKQVMAAQAHFGRVGECPVSFIEGDAENLPLPKNSVDVVLSVETSHTYPHFTKFVREVYRVLRPGGTFHITDFRDPGEIDTMIGDISDIFGSPLKLVDISQRVAQALGEDLGPEGPRRKLAASLCPVFMIPACLQFIGETAMGNLRNKTKVYTMALFHKRSDAVDLEEVNLPAEPILEGNKSAQVADFVWTGYVYIGVYLVFSVWSTVLETLSGLSWQKRPLKDYLIIIGNVATVFFNVVLLCYSVRNNPPCGVLRFVSFFFIFDVLIYCVHRLFHKSAYLYKHVHSMHHRRRCNDVCAIDLFYMHPLDCLLQFIMPINLAFWIAGMDTSQAIFAASSAVIFNTLAHSRLYAYDHLKHHGHEAVSYGVGVFMDKLMGTAYLPVTTVVGTWAGVVVSYYLFQLMGAWIAILPITYMAYENVKVLIALCRRPPPTSSLKSKGPSKETSKPQGLPEKIQVTPTAFPKETGKVSHRAKLDSPRPRANTAK